MPSVRIRCQYDEMEQIARIFKEQSSTLLQMTRRIKLAQTTLADGDWIGRGAKQFYAEMDQKVLPSLKRLTDSMEAGARHIGKAHKIMHQAEEDSSRVFRGGMVGTAAGIGAGDRIPSGPGSGDEMPSGPGSGDEVPTTSSTEQPTGPGSGDEMPS